MCWKGWRRRRAEYGRGRRSSAGTSVLLPWCYLGGIFWRQMPPLNHERSKGWKTKSEITFFGFSYIHITFRLRFGPADSVIRPAQLVVEQKNRAKVYPHHQNFLYGGGHYHGPLICLVIALCGCNSQREARPHPNKIFNSRDYLHVTSTTNSLLMPFYNLSLPAACQAFFELFY